MARLSQFFHPYDPSLHYQLKSRHKQTFVPQKVTSKLQRKLVDNCLKHLTATIMPTFIVKKQSGP
jgi:hypothetical protein